MTLRILIFKDASLCEKWCREKYQAEGWEEHYDKVDHPNYTGYHAKAMNKRIAHMDNVLLTCGTITDCNEPVLITDHYINSIRKAIKKKKS